MGNSLLGRFGMSVDNFKAVKDPNTGSYSLSFQRQYGCGNILQCGKNQVGDMARNRGFVVHAGLVTTSK